MTASPEPPPACPVASPSKMSARTLYLNSSDGVIFEVEESVMQCSDLICDMLDHGFVENGEIFLSVRAELLVLITKWARHHKHDSPVKKEQPDYISEWDHDFLDVDVNTRVGIITTASYLGIKVLFRTVCASTAKLISEETMEQVKLHFNIPDDVIPGGLFEH